MTDQPPEQDKVSVWVRLVQGLTLGNVLVIFLLAAIAVPVVVVWRAVSGNEALLNRLLSQYEERPDESGCLVRHVKERGGPDQWGISAAFAAQGIDRYFITVIRSHQPTSEEIQSYCEVLKAIVDQMRSDRGDRIDGPAR